MIKSFVTKTDFLNIVFIIEIIVPPVMLWFPVGICKHLFQDSNNGEGGVRYLPISLYHTHIIAYTCALCLFCRPRWRIQLPYNRWTYLSHCVRTKMISRDLKLQCHKCWCWHCQEQSMDNESNCDKRQRDRETENGHWYQDFSCTWIHALTFSNNHTNSHTQTHTQEKCVCVFARAVCACVIA